MKNVLSFISRKQQSCKKTNFYFIILNNFSFPKEMENE